MNLVFTRIQGENSCSRLRSLLLYSCDVFQALNSLPLFTGCTSGSAGIYSISSLQRMIIPEVSFQLSVVHSADRNVVFAGNTENFEEPFSDTSKSPSAVAIAFYNGLWAFDGW